MALRAIPLALALAAAPVLLQNPAIRESSGLAASGRNPGVFWTHNDSGDGACLYAFDRQGRDLGAWTVRGASATDWEDIAAARDPRSGAWTLYIADTGDNRRGRKEVIVWRVPEPAAGASRDCRKGCATGAAAALRLRYPDGPHDAEALLVHPGSGDLYIVTKAGAGDRDTIVFVARARRLRGARPVVMEEVARLDVPDALFARLAGGVTGGSISPGGRGVVLCYYFGIYEAALPPGERDFDAIWDQPFRHTSIGFGLQIEGVCYTADGKSILAATESSPAQLLEVPAQASARHFFFGAPFGADAPARSLSISASSPAPSKTDLVIAP